MGIPVVGTNIAFAFVCSQSPNERTMRTLQVRNPIRNSVIEAMRFLRDLE